MDSLGRSRIDTAERDRLPRLDWRAPRSVFSQHLQVFLHCFFIPCRVVATVPRGRILRYKIRALVHKNKRKCRNNLIDALASRDPKDSSPAVKSILQEPNGQGKGDPQEAGVLDLREFTNHEATANGKGYTPPIIPLEMTPDFERKVYNAIVKAKRNRASGTDELFSEAFKVAPKTFARIFALLWTKSSQLGYLIHEWRTALLVPIYKRGPRTAPSSYRPIALLSHGRQMISKAIGVMIREDYTFHPTQLGFRERAGTETAILRHAASTEKGFKYTAVLDLKGAYPSVPRDKLMETVHAKLSPRTAAMISLELQPETIITKGDTKGTTGKITLGVPQGGSSRPPLYNVYMDSFCEQMESELRTDYREEEVDVSVFADDVKIRSRTAKGLQKGLDVCTKWASKAKMTWSAPKCHILEPESPSTSRTQREYFLSGERVQVSDSAVYLGVTLRGTRIAPDKNLERIRAAFQRIGILKAIGLNRKLVPSSKLIEICRTYVYPVADYGLHLIPLEKNQKCVLSKQLELLDYKVVEYSIGCVPKAPVQRLGRRIGGRLSRHLKLAKLPDWLQRIRMRLYSLQNRLQKRRLRERSDMLARQDPANLSAFRKRNQSPPNLTKKGLREFWTQLCRRCRRQIPIPKSGLVPILNEKDRKARDAGIKWYCGSFPGNPERLQTGLGLAQYTRHKVRIHTGMQAEHWSGGVRRRTVESLQVFLEVLTGLDETRKKRTRDTEERAFPSAKRHRKST